MEVKAKQSFGIRPHRRVRLLVFFLVLTVISLLLHIEKYQRRKQVMAARQKFSTIVRAQPVEMVKVQRGRFYKTQYYLNYPVATSFAVADFISRLHSVIPPRRLRGLQINPGLQNFSFLLTLGIAAGGMESASMTAARYLEEMRDFPEIMQLALAKSDLPPGPGAQNRVCLFSITGHAEMQ